MGFLLGAIERRVGRHRPAPDKVRMAVGSADVVEPIKLLDRRFSHLVGRPHRVDESVGPAYLAGAVVQQQQDDRVVELAIGGQGVDPPDESLFGVVQHRGISRLQPGRHCLLRRRVRRPRATSASIVGMRVNP